MSAVPGEPHQVGDLAEAGFDAVAPLGDDLLQDGGHADALVPGGRDEHRGAAGGLSGGECLAVEALVAQQVAGRRPGLEQVFGDLALVDRGGHDAPGAHDPAAQTHYGATSTRLAGRRRAKFRVPARDHHYP
jgi:hypothetical protein